MAAAHRRMRLASAGAAFGLLLAGGIALAPGFWHAQQANAKTITTKCVNGTSDAATLNAAIGASKPGDQIFITGQCLLTSPVTLLGDRSYEGGSRTGTVLKQASGANLPYLLASDAYVANDDYAGDPFSIHQLTINCNGAGNTAATDGLVIHSWQTQVTDLQVENCNGSGIELANVTPNGTVLAPKKTMVNGSISGNFIQNSGVSGVYVQDDGNAGNAITDWHLDDNYIAGSGQDAIHLQNAAGWYVDGNHLYGDGNSGIYANRLFGTSISNNYIEDFGKAGGNTTWYGIDGTVQGDAASTIADNRVFMFPAEQSGTSYQYIALTQVNYGAGYVSVTGNEIRGAGSTADTGFYYNAGSSVTLNVTSSGNSVNDVGTARTTGTGVTISGGI